VKAINGTMRYCTKTDRGLKRSRNEDSFIVIENIQKQHHADSGTGTLFAVADGMSGHIGGGTASRMAIEGLRKHYMNPVNNRGPIPANGEKENLRDLEKVVLSIHHEISVMSERVEKYKYMGTTLSVLLLYERSALITHVGDSRIYRLRGGHLEQLTHDDTMAQLSVEMGYLQADEAAGHPLCHAVMQALGQGVDELQSKKVQIKSGDVFLLCSDGLYDMVSDNDIQKFLHQSPTGGKPCDLLVEAALANGGSDNVTVIIVQIL